MSEVEGSSPGQARVLHLAARDNVAMVLSPVGPGELLHIDGRPLLVRDPIPAGHKIAICRIAAGEKVIKLGASIGSATQSILAGAHVHSHNLTSDYAPADTVRDTGGLDLGQR